MAIVVVFDKPCVGKSRQSGLHDGQFADARVIVGELRLPHLAEARPPRALAGAHLPAATGLVQQRFAKAAREIRSEEHTSELQSLMRISYAVFCLKKKNKTERLLQDRKDTHTSASQTHHKATTE